MSSVFSKSREKRSRSSSNEANNSFVKNVTSRVSGLLPATITKWFSGSSSSPSANGSAQTADGTDSSTEDEGPEGSGLAQPPNKRMRFNQTSPGNYNHYAPSETNCIPATAEKIVLEPVTPYGTVQSPPGRTTFRRETNYVSTPFSNRSSEDSLDSRTDKDSLMFKSQHMVSSIGPSVATKRKSLFDSPNSDASIKACEKTASNTMRDPNLPCFKPGLLGSPFYPGRTMYGGASSSYINSPNIKHRKTTLVNQTSTTDNTISQSTKRIMDLLEHYSSPLNEARRIPPYTRKSRNDSFDSSASSTSPNKLVSYKTQELHVPSIATILRLKQRSRLMDTTNAARQIIASHSSSMDFVPYSPPRITHTQREQTEIETSNNNKKLTTKVKTKLTRPKRTGHNDETEMAAPVVLPSATLHIDQNNLPKFTFNTIEPPKSKLTEKDTTSEVDGKKQDNIPTIKITETPLRKPETITSSSYKFSSPVKLSRDEAQSTSTPPKFTFGSPERSIDKTSVNKDVSCDVIGSKKPEEAKKEWVCPDCWVNNKVDAEKCVCCGYAKPSDNNKKKVKCSVCKLADSQPNLEKCVNCEKISVNNVSVIKPALKVDSSKWKCEDCWVSNEESADKCVCCGGANMKTAAPVKQDSIPNDSEWKCDGCWIKNKSNLDKCAACGGPKPNGKPQPAPNMGLFSAPNNTFKTTKTGDGIMKKWECSSCLVRNDNDKLKCVCCETAKPGTSSESKENSATPSLFSTPSTTKDNTFNTIVKTQTSKWECPSCLVRNESDKSKCACCEADKPGTSSESEKKTFNFGISDTSFKFGIDPNAQAKPAEVKPAESKEEETNNNVLSKTPSFSFGMPSKLDDQVTPKKSEGKTGSGPKVNFSFGIPKSAATSTPVTSTAVSTPAAAPVSATPALPIFGILTKPAEPAKKPEEEKPQEVPKVEFNLLKQPSPVKVTPNLFTTPLSSASTEKPASPFSSKNPSVTATFVMNSSGGLTEKKEPALTTVVSTSAGIAPQPSFTFGSGSSLAPTSVSFGAPAPTTLNNTESLFKKPELPTTAPTLSTNLFAVPKSDAPSSVSIFQKTEAPPATTTAGPLFSFGNNAQTAPQSQPQPEKPKFNFTFGSTNKTEFKSTFGSTAEKFGVTTGNALGGANTLGGNGLSTSNVIPAGNGISINPISGDTNNPLANNNMQQASGIFGAATQKENMWSTANNNASNNLFASNATTSGIQKPAFTFGSSTPFNPSAAQASTPFNNNTATPAFGSSTPTNNVFGMSNNNSSSIFGQANQAPVFGSPQASNPTPSLFGSPSVGATPTFGTPNQAIPSFEASASAPAFSFGSSPSSAVFGFGGQQQQQQQQQSQQQSNQAYNFGGAAAGPLQFNMGSQPSAAPAVRRVRRAFRRNTPR